MNYNIINFTDIPDKWTFYYLSENGKQYKCRKIGTWGFAFKDGPFTCKRYCPFPKGWYCAISERSYKKLMK